MTDSHQSSALYLTVYGKVQGVGYRRWVRETAQSRNLKGWVCNNPDGTVRMVLIGPKVAIDDVVMRCTQGSSASDVEYVVSRSWAGSEPAGFTIVESENGDEAIDGRGDSSRLIFRKIKLPSVLNNQKNGEVTSALLCTVRQGSLLVPVAKKWNEMRRAALRDGVLLTTVSSRSTYRSFEQQAKIFSARYQVGEKDEVGAVAWNDRYWVLKSGMARAAVPGTSNHGWGVSVDVQMLRNDGVKEWLLNHAVRFGFCWEYASKPWRLTYYLGDGVAPIWSARCVELATPGRWLEEPATSFKPMNIVASKSSYRKGDAILMAENDRGPGIHRADVAKLATFPAAVITSAETEQLPRFLIEKCVPVYQVQNNRKALVDLARFARSRLQGKVIGVTGTAGKTSTSKMLTGALSALGKEVYRKNYGNLSGGISKALRSAPWGCDFYVIEMAQGTMGVSATLAAPDVAVITNIGPGHLDMNGSPLNVARKKSRIFRGVVDGGAAVICLDTEHADILITAAREQQLRVYTYGQHPQAGIRLLAWAGEGGSALIETPSGSLSFTVTGGLHMVENAMACIAVVQALGLDISVLPQCFSSFQPLKGRGQSHKLWLDGGTSLLVDESYNANPLSMKAAIEASNGRFKNGGFNRHVLVLGDMLELGEDEIAYHQHLAHSLCEQPPDILILLGPLMAELASAFKHNQGMQLEWFDSVEKTLEWATSNLKKDDLIMVKSSNGTGLHRFVTALLEQFRAP